MGTNCATPFGNLYKNGMRTRHFLQACFALCSHVACYVLAFSILAHFARLHFGVCSKSTPSELLSVIFLVAAELNADLGLLVTISTDQNSIFHVFN